MNDCLTYMRYSLASLGNLFLRFRICDCDNMFSGIPEDDIPQKLYALNNLPKIRHGDDRRRELKREIKRELEALDVSLFISRICRLHCLEINILKSVNSKTEGDMFGTCLLLILTFVKIFSMNAFCNDLRKIHKCLKNWH